MLAPQFQYQFMYGDAFLVAPVVDPGVSHWNVYLPAGWHWYDFSSASTYDAATDGRFRVGAVVYAGGEVVRIEAPLEVLPMFVREGSVVPALDPAISTVNPSTDGRVASYYDR